MAFGHLHVHTEHSTLDGMGRVEEYLKRASLFKQPYMAITDHGQCGGLYELDKLCDKYGIKPIFGCEFYLDNGFEEKRNHLILLAKDEEGLGNLYELYEYSHVKNFNSKPTINMEVLSQFSKGLICTSACLANIIPRSLANGNYSLAHSYADKFYTIFGKDFYLEVQSNTIPEQAIANRGIIKLAKDMGIKYIATNDVHYELKEDFEVHDVMLCMQTKKKFHDEKRFRFSSNDFWFKSEEEMLQDLHGLTEEEKHNALETCQEIADKCNVRLKRGNFLPKYYATPEGMTEEQYLRRLVTENYPSKIVATGVHTEQYAKDVRHELKVIEQTGYAGYHLIVRDFIKYAREHGITVGDARGSGAGCKVANIIDITRIEPNKYGLLFERFLDVGRVPDYDVDFADNNAIFSYLQKCYGENNVARITAYGTLAPKAVIGKVFSVFSHPQSLIAKIKGCIPEDVSSLQQAYTKSATLVKYKKEFPNEFRYAERLEGRISHLSQHAGGIVIYEGLNRIVPLQSDSEDRNKRVVAWDKYACEDVGLVKIDCLGLVSLETIRNTLELIKKDTGKEIDLYSINEEDEEVYKDICSGNLLGVFQLEGQPGMTIGLAPKCFRDIIVLEAIIRPGVGDFNELVARRGGKQWSINELRMPYMAETCGLYTYQEQFEQDCQTFAGWTIAYADKKVRKNKHIAEDEAIHKQFIDDSTYRGFDREEMEALWEEIVNCVKDGYSFNKSHATAYAKLTYRTAWLKHYYPQYFYASLMNKCDGDSDKLAGIIAECKKNNIKILPPDINNSNDKFIPTKNGILYALSSVKGLGETAYKHILELRPIVSLEDLITRSTRKLLRENVIVSLIYAGCFPHVQQMDAIRSMCNLLNSKKVYSELSQMDMEKSAFGLYLSKHPMEEYSFPSLDSFVDNGNACIGGIVLDVAEVFDKKGNRMAFVTINSQYGNTKCLAFSSFWNDKKTKHEDFEKGNILLLRGKRSKNDLLLNSYEVLKVGKS